MVQTSPDEPIMSDTTAARVPEVTARHVVEYEWLTQSRCLKPTYLLPVLRAAGDAWWNRYPGQDWDEYCRREMLRPLVTHLRVSTPETELDQGEPIEANLSIGMGARAGREGHRYGGRDEMVVRARGEVVATWSCDWLWLDFGGGDLPTFLSDPPRGLAVDLTELERPGRRPTVDGGQESAFRWTRRETDLNNHVFFLAYLERAENAVTEADSGFEAREWEMWYSLPSFAGERMLLRLTEPDPVAGRLGSMQAAGDDRLCATFRVR